MTTDDRSFSTAVGFRRNIKWFLGALVGFLITLILVLLLFLQVILEQAVQQTHESRLVAFEAARISMEQTEPDASAATLQSRLESLRGSLPLAGIELTRPDGTVLRSGPVPPESPTVSRTIPAGQLALHFEVSPAETLQERFLVIAAIVLGSTLSALVLLVLLMPRIVRPIDRMLEDAKELGERDEHQAEDHYLIETFRRSIARLREQEDELRRLHEFEKARADDLERITSTLTRSLSSGFIALDPRGEIVDLNRAAIEIAGLDGKTTSGKIEEVLGDGPLSTTISESFARRESLSRQEIVDRGRHVVLGVTTVPLYDESDEFLGMLVLFTDLSSIRELEHRMREMQALADLGQISAGIAHEFRNSLGTILGYLKLARRQDDGEKTEAKLRQAETEGHRLADSINALLAFARPVALELDRVELRSLMNRVSERLAAENEDVTISVGGELAEIEGDESLLETMFENVVRNAIESIPEGTPGKVIATIGKPGALATISVRDTGSGIDEDLLSRVFLPFQTGKASGTGLGLPLARKIALLHGGTISITETSENGTEVRIELPERRG